MSDIDAKFEKIYDYYQELISNDHFDGDMYDKVDGILNIIWNSTDAAGAHFYNLESDEDKRTYIVDFTNACDWLVSWKNEFSDDDYKLVAELVVKERA
jgi:hypothetical protein